MASINVTHLARRLKVPTKELLAKLPELGFSVGQRAIKINDKEAARIQKAWVDMKRREALQKKHREEQEREERRAARAAMTKERAIALPQVMTVREFADLLDMPLTETMKELMRAGVFASMNERIDFETATIVASDMGFNVTNADESFDEAQEEALDRVSEILKDEIGTDRAPVIVVMGHVDHGKTRLLDAIRNTNIIDTEAGGITQHIGAYQTVHKDQKVTFIDTPGHEAFTVMRSRGAKVADIAILVVAADDGVQPQTREAADIIKAAGLPMVVAINKIDKDGVNIEKVKRELADINLSPEEWGGSTIMVPISAKQEQNIDELLDAVLLVYEVEKENITADPNRAAVGTIIESHVDKGAGPVATVLIQSGTLHDGEVLGVHGQNYGRVRTMRDYLGEKIEEAGPSVPVQVLGWKVAPAVGDVLEVVDAAMLTKASKSKMRSSSMQNVGPTIKVVKAESDQDGEQKKMLNIILKADVLGSIEAIMGLFEKIHHDGVGVSIVSKALGNVTEADITRAEGSDAVIVCFNTSVPTSVVDVAREKKVEVLEYNIIYKLFEDVVARLQTMLVDEIVREDLGNVEVLAVFKKEKGGMIIGGKVRKGRLLAPSNVRIWRDNELVGEGSISEVRVGKEIVSDVLKGQEAGMQYVGKTVIEEGDVLEIYREEHKKQKLVVEGANA